MADDDADGLSAPEIVMLIEALDAFIRAGEGNDYLPPHEAAATTFADLQLVK